MKNFAPKFIACSCFSFMLLALVACSAPQQDAAATAEAPATATTPTTADQNLSQGPSTTEPAVGGRYG